MGLPTVEDRGGVRSGGEAEGAHTEGRVRGGCVQGEGWRDRTTGGEGIGRMHQEEEIVHMGESWDRTRRKAQRRRGSTTGGGGDGD
uniref:DUF834 domain-containing protein n=1 Tax=Oryza brachyantha TaxID=4533 RepID=J3MLR6_ORYBR